MATAAYLYKSVPEDLVEGRLGYTTIENAFFIFEYLLPAKRPADIEIIPSYLQRPDLQGPTKKKDYQFAA